MHNKENKDALEAKIFFLLIKIEIHNSAIRSIKGYPNSSILGINFSRYYAKTLLNY